MKRLLIILFCLIFFLANFAYAQFSMVDSLTKKFNRHREQILQEKIYAHVNRTSYLTGETLWFSLYYVDASIHHPLNISKVAYVEVVDKNRESVIQAKVELKNGKGRGSLFIPAALISGNYIFRAYTHWMKNFAPEFYFHQPITIVNPFVKTDQEPNRASKSLLDAQFFPEGGYAVEGLKSKIAFRVTDGTGKGISFRGAILNSKNDVVTTFAPQKFGIGHFYFLPEAGEQYKAVIEDSNGDSEEYPFIEIRKSGYIMAVSERGDDVVVDIETATSNVPLVYLFAHARQRIVRAEGKLLVDKKIQFSVNKKEFPEGITHITLFNHELKPMCERLFFKRPDSQLKINTESAQKTYKPRDLVQLFLKPSITANVSVSVYRTDSIPSPELQNIHEYFWLSSDLKGAVESPEYYFSGTDSSVNTALDNLMLTHGWRRFTWDDVLVRKPTLSFIPEYRGHIVYGKASHGNGAPAAGILTTLSAPDRIFQLYGSRSNAVGDVQYEVRNLFEEHRLFTHVVSRADSDVHVKIVNPFSAQYARLNYAPLHLSSALSKPIVNRSIAMQAESIYRQEQQFSVPQPSISDSVQFFGKADETYFLDDYTRFPLMEDVFREYVHGVMVRKQKKDYHLAVVEITNKPLFNEDAMVFLDGVPVFDTKEILELNALKVKKVEVINREYYYGPLTFYGAIFLSTYQGDLGGIEMDTKDMPLIYEGLQLQREFYAPKYDSQNLRNSRVPDQRTSLYWNASEEVTAGKSSGIQFYASDLAGDYKVVIQGLSKDGTPGYSTYYFSVTE